MLGTSTGINQQETTAVLQVLQNATGLMVEILAELQVHTFLLQEGLNIRTNDADSLRQQLLSDGGISRS